MSEWQKPEPVRIELHGLTKTFEKGGVRIEVLKTLDLVIEPGEALSIVGASGVGKSTLLHILGTLDHPTSGTVLFNGTDVFAQDNRSLASLRNSTIGFVFQFHHLLPEFTALENVAMPAIIAGQDMARARARAEDALRAVGLAARLHHQPGEMSGGEQQRVAIARAVVMEPRILLADEPTGNLDIHTGESIHDLLLELNKTRGITLVVVTHNLELADRFSRRFRLTEGHLIEMHRSGQPGGQGV
jgi:lipoprotein-releasing system ATP-binding protein